MRRNLTIFVLVLICSMLCLSITAFSLGYQSDYISETAAKLPSSKMDLYNMTYFNGMYYVAQRDGGLYTSKDIESWSQIGNFNRAFLVGDGLVESEKIVVLSGDTLYVSYNGTTFAPVQQFTTNAVVHYIEGAYVAAAWDSDSASKGNLYISTDLNNWTQVGNETIRMCDFSVKRHGVEYIISGLLSESGKEFSAVVKGGSCTVYDYQSIRYDYFAKQYIMKTNKPSVSITMVYDLSHARHPIVFDVTEGYVDLHNGMIYYAPGGKSDMSRTFFISPGSYENVAESNVMYFFYDSIEYDNGAVLEIWNRVSRGEDGEQLATIIRRSSDGSNWQEATILGGYTIQMYGGVISAVKPSETPGEYSYSYLFSVDGINFHQVDEHTAYALSTLYTQRGDYVFPDADSAFSFVSSPTGNIAQMGIELILDGCYIASDQPPVIYDGSTLAAVRSVAEPLGAHISWDGDTQTATLQKDGVTVALTVNSDIARITNAQGEESEVTLDAAAINENGRIMIPVRFICEQFGVRAEWREDTRSVILSR